MVEETERRAFYIPYIGRKIRWAWQRDAGSFAFVTNTEKPWSGNLKAVADAAAAHPAINRLVVWNQGPSSDEAIAGSLAGAKQVVVRSDKRPPKDLLSCDVMFVHEYSRYGLPNFSVNLWHGIPLKQIGLFQKPFRGELIQSGRFRNQLRMPRDRYRKHQRLIASSLHDRVVMAACFGMSSIDVYNSGLPRNDWLDLDQPMPADLQTQEERLRNQLGGRKLCLYAPTFRDEDHRIIPLSVDEAKSLARQLNEHGFVLGIRPHMRLSKGGFPDLDNVLDLSAADWPEPQVLLRNCDLLLTDYSSIALDFMLLRRPILSYAPDLERYSRGFLYQFEDVFPGPILQRFDALQAAIADALINPDANIAMQDVVRHLFHEQRSKPIAPALIDQILNDRQTHDD
jgi:CDP-glycerol glycerophosphotransferase (TagB/SpsB family)